MPATVLDGVTWRERVRAGEAVRVRARLSVTGIDLLATSLVAFLGGWIIGYLAAAT